MFNPLTPKWLSSKFSLQYYPWVTRLVHQNKGNEEMITNLRSWWLLNKFSLTVPLKNVWGTVSWICILLLVCKEWKGIKSFHGITCRPAWKKSKALTKSDLTLKVLSHDVHVEFIQNLTKSLIHGIIRFIAAMKDCRSVRLLWLTNKLVEMIIRTSSSQIQFHYFIHNSIN